eukprot:527826-Prymnesium_polylepis.1
MTLRTEPPIVLRTCVDSSPMPVKIHFSPAPETSASGSSGCTLSGSERRAKYKAKPTLAPFLHFESFGPLRMPGSILSDFVCSPRSDSISPAANAHRNAKVRSKRSFGAVRSVLHRMSDSKMLRSPRG